MVKDQNPPVLTGARWVPGEQVRMLVVLHVSVAQLGQMRTHLVTRVKSSQQANKSRSQQVKSSQEVKSSTCRELSLAACRYRSFLQDLEWRDIGGSRGCTAGPVFNAGQTHELLTSSTSNKQINRRTSYMYNQADSMADSPDARARARPRHDPTRPAVKQQHCACSKVLLLVTGPYQ